MFTYLTPAGEIDEAAIRRAVAAQIRTLTYRTGQKAKLAEVEATEALVRSDARRAQAVASGWSGDAYDAACAFVRGALEGLTPEPAFYEVAAPAERPIGCFERAEHCQREIYRERRNALDATLARITTSRDIMQFLQAAE